MKNKLTAFYMLICRSFFFDWLIAIFRRIASGGYGSSKCLKQGFLPVPVHFYSPIPDIKDLEKRRVWDQKSEMEGINFNHKNQLVLLKKLGSKYGKECSWPLRATAKEADFFEDNNCFGFGCAAILHSMIREFKPNKVIEIGSGHSSKIISKAIESNERKETDYTIVDPYPQDYILKRKVRFTNLIKKRVELLEAKSFGQLERNDILFIDSSHSVKTGGDVNFLYLEVLPRLNPGVIVHIHDIDLPREYPKVYATSETFRQFWTEQYLLQAFLAFNSQFEILLANNFLMRNYTTEFKRVFPFYNPKVHKAISSSFWMRRK